MNYGETVSIQCTISGGDLPVEVKWTLNDIPLEPYLEIVTEKIGKRINNLMIDSVSAKHAGNYTCIAENKAGRSQFSSNLIVNGLKFSIHVFFGVFLVNFVFLLSIFFYKLILFPIQFRQKLPISHLVTK